MLQQVGKIITTKDGKHGMTYGYPLGKVFAHPLKKETRVLSNKPCHCTLIECEFAKDRARNKGKSQVSEQLDHQEQLKHELEEMSLLLAKKDVKLLA